MDSEYDYCLRMQYLSDRHNQLDGEFDKIISRIRQTEATIRNIERELEARASTCRQCYLSETKRALMCPPNLLAKYNEAHAAYNKTNDRLYLQEQWLQCLQDILRANISESRCINDECQWIMHYRPYWLPLYLQWRQRQDSKEKEQEMRRQRESERQQEELERRQQGLKLQSELLSRQRDELRSQQEKPERQQKELKHQKEEWQRQQKEHQRQEEWNRRQEWERDYEARRREEFRRQENFRRQEFRRQEESQRKQDESRRQKDAKREQEDFRRRQESKQKEEAKRKEEDARRQREWQQQESNERQKSQQSQQNQHRDGLNHRSGTKRTAQFDSNEYMTVAQWRAFTQKCFADYSAMQTFPYPPPSRCTCDKGAGNGCTCQIRAAFRALPCLNPRHEWVRWHPDRFSGCRQDRRDEFQKAAEKIFIVLTEMLEAAGQRSG